MPAVLEPVVDDPMPVEEPVAPLVPDKLLVPLLAPLVMDDVPLPDMLCRELDEKSLCSELC